MRGLIREEALRSVGRGWASLINGLYDVLEEEIASLGTCSGHEEDEDEGEVALCQRCHPPQVLQVKEKFGGLRFYTSWSTPRFEERIEQSTAASYRLCEDCGEPGQLRYDGWLRTLCDACDGARRS